MPRALITGVAGFLGSHLAERLLEEGTTVRGIDNFDPYYERAVKERNLAPLRERSGFEFREGDLGEVDLAPLLEGVDWVFHLAARPGVRASWGEAFADYARINVLATQRLLEALRGARVAKLVFASSSSVYGDAAGATTEDAPCRPISPYGVSKLAAEALVLAYQAAHGVPGVALRYFTVYGPRQRPDMAFHRFLRAWQTGEAVTLLGDGRQVRDFTFVGDAVAGTIAAARRGRPGAVYNIGGGAPASLAEVMEILTGILGPPARVAHDAAFPGDPRATRADTTRARGELDYRPETDLRAGLTRMAEWMRGQTVGATDERA
jgi:nucleoside-diphosphate-sugar epimerase